MEGKEVRFGVAASALFATVTTDASCGAVNSMHDSFTPLGGLVPLVNIQLGEVDLRRRRRRALRHARLRRCSSVFIAGLMVGRTPEYLGKKIEAREMKLAMLYVLIFPLIILGLHGLVGGGAATASSSLNNAGPHGLSRDPLRLHQRRRQQRLGLRRPQRQHALVQHRRSASTMLAGRFLMIVPALAIAGSMVGKKVVPPGRAPSPPTARSSPALLVGVILIVGALTFFPALCARPDRRALPRAAAERCSRRCTSKAKAQELSLFDPAIARAGRARQPAQARAAARGEEPGDVRRRGRQRAHHAALAARPRSPPARRGAARGSPRGVSALALVHRALRQLRRGGGRGPRQGAGRRRCARCARTPRRAGS